MKDLFFLKKTHKHTQYICWQSGQRGLEITANINPDIASVVELQV